MALKVTKGATRYWEDGRIQMHDTAKVQSQRIKPSQPKLQGKGALTNTQINAIKASPKGQLPKFLQPATPKQYKPRMMKKYIRKTGSV